MSEYSKQKQKEEKRSTVLKGKLVERWIRRRQKSTSAPPPVLRKDPYEVLSVSRKKKDSTDQRLKVLIENLLLNILSDPEKRRQYDSAVCFILSKKLSGGYGLALQAAKS
ncbi:hypothetical protein NC651_019045 [Populus alba x Populus x berolinensis]|nr:hypothetical protein NC651_019045 [Populus alba x Populus x berolinensis]